MWGTGGRERERQRTGRLAETPGGVEIPARVSHEKSVVSRSLEWWIYLSECYFTGPTLHVCVE